jgi:ribosomal-protein-alanine N-acetyltransferase
MNKSVEKNIAVPLDARTFLSSYVILEPVHLDVLTDFHEYSLRPEIYEHLEFPPFRSLEDSRRYLEKLLKRSSAPDAQYWFIRLADEEKIVGSIGLHSLDDRRSTVEIGYGISPDYWGRGVFTAACMILLKHVFVDLGLHRLVARTAANNVASIGGLEKLHFRREGIMRDFYRTYDGRFFDALLMSRLSTD